MMLFIGLSLAMPMRADWRRVVIGHAKARVEFPVGAASDDFLARYGHARMFARRPRPVLSHLSLSGFRQTTTPARGGASSATQTEVLGFAASVTGDDVASRVNGALRGFPPVPAKVWCAAAV